MTGDTLISKYIVEVVESKNQLSYEAKWELAKSFKLQGSRTYRQGVGEAFDILKRLKPCNQDAYSPPRDVAIWL